MDEMLDPNAPPDFEQQAIAIARQRKVAELLRKQAGGMPEGQMVSGRFVKPSVLASLAPVLGNFNAHLTDLGADKNERAYQGRAAEATKNWESQLPQAVAGRAELPGPRDEGGSPELNAIPAQPLTTGRILKHTLSGMRIPGNEKAAALTNQALMGELTREDTQQEKRDAAHASAIATAQKQQADLEWKREQLGATLGQKKDHDAQYLALTRDIAEAKNAVDWARIQATRDAAASKADAKKDAADAKITHLPAAQTTAYLNNKTAIGNIDEAADLVTKHPGAVGLKGVAPNIVLSRYGTDDEKRARAAIANIGSLKVHDRSGASVTVSESPRLMPFIPTINDDAKTVAVKLKNLKREAERANLAIEDFAEENKYHRPGTTKITPDELPTKVVGGKTYVQKDDQWYEQ
jgi:hypothetical protein